MKCLLMVYTYAIRNKKLLQYSKTQFCLKICFQTCLLFTFIDCFAVLTYRETYLILKIAWFCGYYCCLTAYNLYKCRPYFTFRLICQRCAAPSLRFGPSQVLQRPTHPQVSTASAIATFFIIRHWPTIAPFL